MNGLRYERHAAMVRTGSRHPKMAAKRIIFPMRTSTGRAARWNPIHRKEKVEKRSINRKEVEKRR
jgi:hypothetical protein